jgi:hypothetical protein
VPPSAHGRSEAAGAGGTSHADPPPMFLWGLRFRHEHRTCAIRSQRAQRGTLPPLLGEHGTRRPRLGRISLPQHALSFSPHTCLVRMCSQSAFRTTMFVLGRMALQPEAAVCRGERIDNSTHRMGQGAKPSRSRHAVPGHRCTVCFPALYLYQTVSTSGKTCSRAGRPGASIWKTVSPTCARGRCGLPH